MRSSPACPLPAWRISGDRTCGRLRSTGCHLLAGDASDCGPRGRGGHAASRLRLPLRTRDEVRVRGKKSERPLYTLQLDVLAAAPGSLRSGRIRQSPQRFLRRTISSSAATKGTMRTRRQRSWVSNVPGGHIPRRAGTFYQRYPAQEHVFSDLGRRVGGLPLCKSHSPGGISRCQSQTAPGHNRLYPRPLDQRRHASEHGPARVCLWEPDVLPP